MTGPAIDRAAVLAAARPELEAVQAELQLGMWRGFFSLLGIGLAFILPAVGASVLGDAIMPGVGGLLAAAVYFVALALWVRVRIPEWPTESAVFKRLMDAVAPLTQVVFDAHREETPDRCGLKWVVSREFGDAGVQSNLVAGVYAGCEYELCDVLQASPTAIGSTTPTVGQICVSLFSKNALKIRAVHVKLSGMRLPETEIRRTHGIRTLAQAPAGLEPVELEGSRFDRVFELYSREPQSARELLDDELLGVLERVLETTAPKTPQGSVAPPSTCIISGDRVSLAGSAWKYRSPEIPFGVVWPDQVARARLDLLLQEIEDVRSVIDAI